MTYEEQTFNEARRFIEQMGWGTEKMFLDLRNAGLLRNDSEVGAFDDWERIPQ